jgi:ribA/ribD-fused uncharacterized protein
LWPLTSPLIFRAIAFHSSEHLYKWFKCKFTGDEEGAREVLAISEPRDLLRLCKHKNAKWTEIQGRVMVSILILKFSRCPILKARLLDTGHAHLIEDTVDPLWGRGRDGDGQNLHGRCLTEARSAIQGFERFSTIIVGDSLLAGIKVHGAEVVSVSGAHGSVTCLLADLFAQDERVTQIIVHVGTNDVFPRPPAQVTVQQLRNWQRMFVGKLGDLSRRTPHIHVAVSLLLPRWCDRDVAPNLLRRVLFNDTLVAKLEKSRASGAQISQIDHRPLFAAAEEDWFASDGLHLSAKGKARFSHVLSQLVGR